MFNIIDSRKQTKDDVLRNVNNILFVSNIGQRGKSTKITSSCCYTYSQAKIGKQNSKIINSGCLINALELCKQTKLKYSQRGYTDVIKFRFSFPFTSF